MLNPIYLMLGTVKPSHSRLCPPRVPATAPPVARGYGSHGPLIVNLTIIYIYMDIYGDFP